MSVKHILEHNLRSRRIFLWGDIEPKLAKKVVYSLRYLGYSSPSPIYIYINSNGGYIDDTVSIIDEMEGIKSCGVDVYTIAQGQAYSAAAIILSLGSPNCRYITPNSTVMLHQWSYDLDSDYATQQKKTSDFFNAQSANMYKLVAKACNKNTPKKMSQFLEDVEKTIWLNAKQAEKYGIVDGIWDFGWEKEIDAERTIEKTNQ